MDGIYSYWGKEDGSCYHLLPYHCLDVAAVGRLVLEDRSSLLEQFVNLSTIDSELFLNWITFLLAIHDIGKFADGFQAKKPDLFQQLQNRNICTQYKQHDTLGYYFCLENLPNVFDKDNKEDLRDFLIPWLSSVCGHHGRPPKLECFPQPLHMQFPNPVTYDTLSFIQEIKEMWLINLNVYKPYKQCISWLVAGLTVVADWIGSNQQWFPYCNKPMPLRDYWYDIALPQAKKAVLECGLTAKKTAQFSGIKMLFSNIFFPTPLQQLVEKLEIPDGPQLFIIEEVTGGGKTEAALTLAHRLMAKGISDGLYMALPTMATANAMHKRIKDMYQKLFLEHSHPSLILAHSMNRMVLKLEQIVDKDYSKEGITASQDCAVWLSDSRKKALLADVGVGTIDQILLAILPVRYQSLRLLGMSRKILIVDEVHACDAYIHRLLCTLLKFHASFGGSAILLSATLPKSMRDELLKSFASAFPAIKADVVKSDAYPLLTHLSATGIRGEFPISACKSVSQKVKIQPIHSIDEVKRRLKGVLDDEGCACWVRNTVYDAMQSYYEWLEHLDKERIILFHSRFTLADRLRIENEVRKSFGPTSTDKERCGKLLIATQVVEQSLDLDFDFMVSDLAPIDLIIQRAGRLQRHRRGLRKPPVLGVYMPYVEENAGKDWLKEMFPKAASVYDHHGQLWLTAKWIDEHQEFICLEDAREMIESVYGELQQALIPEALQIQECNAEGKDSAKKSSALLNSLNLQEGYQASMTSWEDDISAPTRLGEPTVTVRLARWDGNSLVPWYNQNTGNDWELSQLTIRKSQIAKEDPNSLPEFVTLAKQTMPDNGRHCVTIPIKQCKEKWIGQAMDDYDKIVSVIYDNHIGLEIKKKVNV